MSGGTLNSNSISSENEQRLVMLGKYQSYWGGADPQISVDKCILHIFYNVAFLLLAGDGKTDADDETCRTFIFRYRKE